MTKWTKQECALLEADEIAEISDILSDVNTARHSKIRQVDYSWCVLHAQRALSIGWANSLHSNFSKLQLKAKSSQHTAG